jgi:hypothetical protein
MRRFVRWRTYNGQKNTLWPVSCSPPNCFAHEDNFTGNLERAEIEQVDRLKLLAQSDPSNSVGAEICAKADRQLEAMEEGECRSMEQM